MKCLYEDEETKQCVNPYCFYRGLDCPVRACQKVCKMYDPEFSYQYCCCYCSSVSPLVLVTNGLDAAKAKALELALHRAVPENCVLTLEEATGSDDPVWVETMNALYFASVCVAPDIKEKAQADVFDDAHTYYLPLGGYGKTWRCWQMKPTEKDMDTPWRRVKQ